MLHHLPVWLVLVLFMLLGLANLCRLYPGPGPQPPVAPKARPQSPRPLHPRTPDDYPVCREGVNQPASTATPPASPWRTGKRRRGRRKTINSDGFACPNPKCKLYHVRDANVHALVGYGHHGRHERIRDLACQACHRKSSVRRHTMPHDFGQWVQVAREKRRQWQVAVELVYGQVNKTYRRRKLAKVERRMRWGRREAFQARLQALGVSRTLNSAFVERINRTIRRGIAALQRRSWSTRQTQ